MRTRVYAAGIIAGIGLLAVTLVLVVAFGRHNPSPPSLTKDPRPEIPGEILFGDSDGCFVRAQASGLGEPRVSCSLDARFGRDVYWVAPDTLQWVQQDSPQGGQLYELDLATGEQTVSGRTVTIPAPPVLPMPRLPNIRNVHGCLKAPDGVYACISDDGALVIVDGDLIQEVATFDLPEYNVPNIRAWSPDSRWVVLQYQPQRENRGPEIWIVKRDGSIRGTLAKGTGYGGIAWRIEGVGAYPPSPY